MRRSLSAGITALGLVACSTVEGRRGVEVATTAMLSATATPSPSAAPSADVDPKPAESAWALATRSPSTEPVDPARDPRELTLLAGCGTEDAALTHVARDLVAARARGLGTPDPEMIVAKLRAAGEPHVRPKLIVASGRAPLDLAKLGPELARPTRANGGSHGPLRCGIALAPTPHGGEVLVALRVEALADLAPLPTRARTGEWLTLEARLHVGARSAKLVVLGPRGLPRTVPTSLDPVSGVARARFALDQPGAFTVQLVGEVSEGPRPLLEARVFADVAPPPVGESPVAPGEEAAGVSDDDASLVKMVAALRVFEGLRPLTHDDRLDALARAHATRMRDGHTVAHDLGDGDPRERFEAEGNLDARAVGENVAHAATLALAHRALYASPSHRINLLRAEYTHMGIGVARSADGSVYVCETFAAR